MVLHPWWLLLLLDKALMRWLDTAAGLASAVLPAGRWAAAAAPKTAQETAIIQATSMARIPFCAALKRDAATAQLRLGLVAQLLLAALVLLASMLRLLLLVPGLLLLRCCIGLCLALNRKRWLRNLLLRARLAKPLTPLLLPPAVLPPDIPASECDFRCAHCRKGGRQHRHRVLPLALAGLQALAPQGQRHILLCLLGPTNRAHTCSLPLLLKALRSSLLGLLQLCSCRVRCLLRILRQLCCRQLLRRPWLLHRAWDLGWLLQLLLLLLVALCPRCQRFLLLSLALWQRGRASKPRHLVFLLLLLLPVAPPPLRAAQLGGQLARAPLLLGRWRLLLLLLLLLHRWHRWQRCA